MAVVLGFQQLDVPAHTSGLTLRKAMKRARITRCNARESGEIEGHIRIPGRFCRPIGVWQLPIDNPNGYRNEPWIYSLFTSCNERRVIESQALEGHQG